MTPGVRFDGPPAFLITIDTEGDNAWAKPRTVTTKNTKFIPRFQELCERFGFKPTYLTDWEMAEDPEYVKFAKPLHQAGKAEVGMHLHGWYSPPDYDLTGDDMDHQPFLTEYPLEVMEAKITEITRILEDRFESKMTSHRAGRWGFDNRYARILESQGYLVDCSVAPNFTFQELKGDPKGKGGPDFRRFSNFPYFMDLDDISRPGKSKLLQVPMTVLPPKNPALAFLSRGNRTMQRVAIRLGERLLWLRPTNGNLPIMLDVLSRCEEAGYPHLEFMLHSSEFMPGGSPTFPDEASIEGLFSDMEVLFARASKRWTGMTMTEFYRTAKVVA